MLIKRFTETAVLPRRATEGSAGYDLSADLSQPEVIQPGESKLLPTGIGVVLPPQTAGLVFGRSGLGARHGIVPANAVGVIDWDYRGEIKVPLRNQGSEPYTVQPGERIAQMLVVPVLTPGTDPYRRSGQFGTRGKGLWFQWSELTVCFDIKSRCRYRS